MNHEQMEVLHKIALDVAVIKTELIHLKQDTEKLEEISTEVTQLKSQMNVAKWLGGVLGTSVLSLWIGKLKGLI